MTSTLIESEDRREYRATRRRGLAVDLSMTLATILAALAIGFLVMLATGKDPVRAYEALLTGPLERSFRVGRWLEDATTLTLLGLSVAIPFRARQISLGAESQLYAGALAAATVAVFLPLPPVAAVIVPLVAAAAAGAGMGFVPGSMKARLGANEIVATLMLNAIVVRVYDYLVNGPLKEPGSSAVHSERIRPDSALTPLTEWLGIPFGRANVGFLLMLLTALALWLLITRTPLGYRIRMTGSNPHFAEYGGIRVPRAIEWSFVIGGAVAGLAGAHLVQGVYGRLEPGLAGSLAFEGIVVALLARNNPLVVVVAGLFYSYLRAGGDIMEQQTDVGTEIVVVIQAVIVLLVTAQALPDLLKRRIARRQADTSGGRPGAAHREAGAR
ncbi:ABC transporter permease [Streptomyces europaeiscabiei]|uniref:ABC transporter permease n=1 Tax=Streptomyces europaeiscabiei TaxID=146819 RepID=UPI0029A32553|nr:ABC transporter permease [Streptomyces europaeiscabiei]MDX3691995.1 ABC transporter permease [Streptomyces europaeiscabiei]WSG21987.1 ABC transporter permease [Streptomyces europaeiscabiei]